MHTPAGCIRLLEPLHMHAGETVYCIKRGSMQHAFHGEAAGIESASVVRYRSRHL